ncbi:MAG TPA: ABC transporter permease subunit [Candidatus Saccharimonadales bacterium]|nr:ABC transporter permease subunit [Candidatus Saccharimonadales bacterium]
MSRLASPDFKIFHFPSTVVGRFVAHHTMRSAALWALIFGAYVATKSVGYAKAYPTTLERLRLAHSFGSNVGLEAILGTPHHLETVVGYAAWNCFGVITTMGAIWAFLLATKYFRGEETAGRVEAFLSGPTTAARAAGSTILGLSASLLMLFLIVALLFIGIGLFHIVGFSAQAAVFFALSAVSAAAFFMSVGALASQLMPTRARASSLAVFIFGICFVIRATADISSLHWLLNVTPLGWVEKLQPLVGSQPIWLLPIFGGLILFCGITIWLAGRRDLGDSLFADKDYAKPRTRLLNTPLMASVRLTRATSIAWLAAIGVFAFSYGLLTKAAVSAFQTSGSFQKVVNRVEEAIHVNFATLFLGIIFLLLMTLVMAYAASAVSKIRDDEANGYLDNFLVRPVGRLQWLWGRILLVTIVCIIACGIGGLGAWAGQAAEHIGVPFHSLLQAGGNMLAPVLFTVGAGIFTLGIWPRLTSVAAYSVLGWSFLISMISSGVNLSHWILDTSVLHQIALAPAVSPNWTTDVVMVGLGLVLSVIGSMVFSARDLRTE